MRLAYADPPYPGQAARHYGAEAEADGRVAREVNHALLVRHLCDEYPDGWALSTSTPALASVLALCPDDVRVGAWVKPFAVFKPNVNPGYCWEPVIWRGGNKRERTRDGAANLTIRDWVSVNIVMRGGTHGSKPWEFCWWVFDLLGVTAEDEFTDIFPGSGAVTDALGSYLGRLPARPGTLWEEAS